MARKVSRSSKALPSEGAIAEQPRMRQLYAAVLREGGYLPAVLSSLHISAGVLARQLSLLRTAGVARTITVCNPLLGGAPAQSIHWIKLVLLHPDDIERFETFLLEDTAVTSAQKVTGDADYRVVSFHPSWIQALAWARAVRCRPEVASLRQHTMRHLFGHELDGFVLHGQGLDDRI